MGGLAGLAVQKDSQLAYSAKSLGGTSPEHRVLEVAGLEVRFGRGWPGAGRFVALRTDAGVGRGRLEANGALGAFLGPSRAMAVLLGTIFIAGAMSIVEVIRQGKVRETLHNVWIIFIAYSTFHIHDARGFTLDNPGLLKIPFGVAVALSMGLFYVIMAGLRFFPK